MNKTLTIILALALLSSPSLTRIQIWSPDWLSSFYKRQGNLLISLQTINLVIHTSISSFGRVPYGHNIIGRVELASPIDACSDLQVNPQENSTDNSPLIVLALRGNCTFADKAINAQAVGAVAILVVDDKEENVHYVLPYSKPEKTIAVTTPALLLSKKSSEGLLKAVKKHNEEIDEEGTEVVVSLSFPLRKEDKAYVDFKFDLTASYSVDDILELMTAFDEIKKKLVLTPVFDFHVISIEEMMDKNKSPFNCMIHESKSLVCTKRPNSKLTLNNDFYHFKRRKESQSKLEEESPLPQFKVLLLIQ